MRINLKICNLVFFHQTNDIILAEVTSFNELLSGLFASKFQQNFFSSWMRIQKWCQIIDGGKQYDPSGFSRIMFLHLFSRKHWIFIHFNKIIMNLIQEFIQQYSYFDNPLKSLQPVNNQLSVALEKSISQLQLVRCGSSQSKIQFLKTQKQRNDNSLRLLNEFINQIKDRSICVQIELMVELIYDKKSKWIIEMFQDRKQFIDLNIIKLLESALQNSQVEKIQENMENLSLQLHKCLTVYQNKQKQDRRLLLNIDRLKQQTESHKAVQRFVLIFCQFFEQFAQRLKKMINKIQQILNATLELEQSKHQVELSLSEKDQNYQSDTNSIKYSTAQKTKHQNLFQSSWKSQYY